MARDGTIWPKVLTAAVTLDEYSVGSKYDIHEAAGTRSCRRYRVIDRSQCILYPARSSPAGFQRTPSHRIAGIGPRAPEYDRHCLRAKQEANYYAVGLLRENMCSIEDCDRRRFPRRSSDPG